MYPAILLYVSFHWFGRSGVGRISPLPRRQGLQPLLSRWTPRAWPVMALAVALPAAVHAAEAQVQRPGLFSPAEPPALRAVAMAPPEDITIRRRGVTIDFDALAMCREAASEPARPPAKLTLNLFDDAVLTAIIDQTAPTSSGYSLSGRIEGVELGTVTLVVNGTVVAGSVRTPSGTFRVRSVGKRLYAISEVDESKLPPID